MLTKIDTPRVAGFNYSVGVSACSQSLYSTPNDYSLSSLCNTQIVFYHNVVILQMQFIVQS